MSLLASYLQEAARLVDSYILENVRGEPAKLYEAALHLIRAGGKRLRPAVVLASAEACGAPREKALPFAAAVEVLHTFTLIHDDIMDRDEVRRGVPTVHVVWGEPMAITAGDLLFAKAFELLLQARDRGVPLEDVVEACRILAEASRVIAEGQALDMDFETRETVTVDEYLEMISKKTAALFKASALLGAVAASAPRQVREKLAEYGWRMGMAFQIIDDILGIIGEEKELGKPVYSDIREGKKTLPIIYALEHLDPKDREKLRSILGKRDAPQTELAMAAELVKSSGAIDYSYRLAMEYVEAALDSLNILPHSRGRRVLEEIARLVIHRRR